MTVFNLSIHHLSEVFRISLSPARTKHMHWRDIGEVRILELNLPDDGALVGAVCTRVYT